MLGASSQMMVAGVDGCKGGWLVVLTSCDQPEHNDALIVASFAEILSLPQQPVVIAVDMPIGLPDVVGPGGRGCDVAARSVLGARRSALFAVPSREAVALDDYRAACAVAARTSQPSRMVSKQCFNLFPKIREIDAIMSPHMQSRVVECHPEVAFWAMGGGALLQPKKIKGRANLEGMVQRRELLTEANFPVALLERVHFPAGKAGIDDVLDACACAWSAQRFASGKAVHFPDHPGRDGRGLLMQIWA